MRLCVSFHHNTTIYLIIYGLGMYIVTYSIHVLMPALLSLPTVDTFSLFICEKQECWKTTSQDNTDDCSPTLGYSTRNS